MVKKASVSVVAMLLIFGSFSVVCSAQWEAVVGGDSAIASGFGSGSDVFTVGSSAVFDEMLYIGTIALGGFEIWRSADGVSWQSAASAGLGDTANEAAYFLVEFDGYLYVGTSNVASGCQVFRSQDGTTWAPLVTDGFGSNKNWGAYSATVFKSALYVGTLNISDGAQLWKTSDGTSWARSNLDGFGSNPASDAAAWMEEFQSSLFIGAGSNARVWKSDLGSDWEQVNATGFGFGSNEVNFSLESFKGQLYAGTTNRSSGAQVWRSADGSEWIQVAADGIDDAQNTYVYSMLDLGGYLYLGTRNLNTGAEVWQSSDGVNWTQINVDGFGKVANDHVRTLIAFGGHLYAGTGAFPFPVSATPEGCELWRTEMSSVFVSSFETENLAAWSETVE